MERKTETVIRTISLPADLSRRIFGVVADRSRRGEGGGFSAAVRELVRPELERREQPAAGRGTK